ncbi:hypothetical protein [Actinocorallia populi]|uniref:hypothetical protein n=1 Tax=Actinocorallia populi TaxID=2079200 RepID=UPI000D09463B|nr:hypothetical protein [Actinocorallia populi]
MGRFVYSMQVSLDLRIEQVPGDNGAGEWLRIDEELHREANAQTQALALMPSFIGFGRPLFDDYGLPVDLGLLEQRSFEQGVTMHRYAVRDAKEAISC